ncbi:MAG TPA: chromosome segregation protein SMC [Candidatus Onthenecus intestinigallinarum]|uniref:Chromosome partition protein Smc n=1 Tax=Candidatus Onthenecus intestinigallinarum TaxID=2840875 RepID=A0A9D1CSM0_9FIRM|nr:chromosome segregation protein SMC [Candidatus Onthenecus intestinigallinarum]
MRLKKLEIYGFKSFADRTEIVFDQGITGIVGPNGSGKSNISDAVRWVLGEQNARSLRGGRMEDIIFGGTEKRKKLGYCEVSLTFDNEDRALPVDFSEVCVTRRVYRSGESEYQLNKTACRLRDIIDLFRDTGIGKEGYSLIGQGRIDEILSARSEDRRQTFEEAAGIVKYKVRKDEAQRRMENTRQNLLRVEDILEELQGQLEPLQQQSETARRYIALREELRGLELNAFVVRSDRAKERMDALQKTLDGLQEAIAEGERRSQADAQERAQQEEAVAELDRQVSAAHALSLDLTRELEAREGENNVLRAEIAHARQDEERLCAQMDEADKRLAALAELARSSSGDAGSRSGLLEEGRAQLAAMEADLARAQARAEETERTLDANKAAIIDAMNRLSDVRATQTRLTTMRQSLEKRLEESVSQQGDMERERARLQAALEAAQAALSEVDGGLREMQEEAGRLDAQVRAHGERGEKLRAQLQELLGSQQALTSRLRVLREMERDYEGYQHAVKQVLLYGEKQGGVHGVVATLIRAPKAYERAIEAVLGGALQNVVTEDEYVAKDMIDYLRRNRFGRATFLPLTSVHGRVLTPAERQALSTPGCLGVASELISFDEKYRGVVENLLGRTVIAENLDAGIQIMRRGRHAFRLVTLEGDVMHSGGSMTGGSSQSRMTSLLSREREIGEHEQRIAQNEAQIAAIRKSLEEIEQSRAEEKRLRGEMFSRLHQEEIAVAREQERVSSAQAELMQHETRMRQAQAMREQIGDNLQDIAEQLAGMTQRQDGAQQDTARMQQETARLSQAQAEERAQVDAMREQVTARRVELAALERELEALRRDGARLEEERKALAACREESGRALADSRARQAQAQAQLSDGEAERDACGARLAQAKEALEVAQGRRADRQRAVRELTERLDALRETVAQDVDKHHRAELQLSRAQSELNQLQERIWEDYELTYAGALEFRDPAFEPAESEKRIASIRGEIRQMGSVNVNAVEDYRACRERYDDLCAQRDDLLRAQEDLQGIIEGLISKMEKQFKQNFDQLNVYFTQTFTRLFGGGRAELKLEDPTDVLNCGIEIVAQPPGKKLQLLSLLSGGERALTAIAILFAMLRLKPTPFCILDEIEAALDDANISYYADYLKEFAQNTQFVVVTHRKGTMERCDALYGVAMEEKGVSRMISVQLSDQLEEGGQS